MSGFSFGVEYVTKGSDPHTINKEDFSTGKALQVTTSYAKNNLGFNITARALTLAEFQNILPSLAYSSINLLGITDFNSQS